VATNGLKLGVVGLGVGATGHIPTAIIEGFDVVAIAARNADKLKDVGDQYGIAGRYTDYAELLKHPGLDAVAITTPSPVHFEMVMQALEAGKHIMLEKPFAMTSEEALAMRDKAKASGLTTMLAEAYRFSPARAYVKTLVEEGYLGIPRGISVTFFGGPRDRPAEGPPRQHWRLGMASGGGFSTGQASTFFDSVLDWFGPVTAINGRTFQAHPGAKQPDGQPADADESVVATFELANGAWGSFTASTVASFGPGGRITLVGSEGALEITQPGLISTNADTVAGGRFADGKDIKQLDIPKSLFEIPDERDPKPAIYQIYRRLFREFAAGIAAGSSPSPNFDDAYQLQRITNALHESSQTGAWVEI